MNLFLDFVVFYRDSGIQAFPHRRSSASVTEVIAEWMPATQATAFDA